MTATASTHIEFLLDRSGSMQSIKADIRGRLRRLHRPAARGARCLHGLALAVRQRV